MTDEWHDNLRPAGDDDLDSLTVEAGDDVVTPNGDGTVLMVTDEVVVIDVENGQNLVVPTQWFRPFESPEMIRQAD